MKPQHILIDADTRRVLALTPLQSVAIQLQRITAGSWWYPDAQFPNYKGVFPLEHIEPAEYATYVWDAKQRALSQKSGAVPEEILQRSHLATARAAVLTRISLVLSTMRAEFDTGIALQESIYIEKTRQARLVHENNDASDVPYVDQHAELTGMSRAQAAKDILFAAKLAHETLLRTEELRLAYNARLREAKTPEACFALLRDFLKDARPDSLS